ncbi:autotransporter outer membrane beta-barrel domain-containing protein [Beijerinckia mobilis]|uniref:autotransporter outer membrane beta-barrel domain-containing protein n=1 Tax=Beijerinckia mobilis TaxID=231434 RepID=UPI00054EA47E|nr:autotransporter outer membrane beta-barrel domain-containing protein [Beijerinckia mobilis]
MENGQCTNNGVAGVDDPAAFSGAALASQALSELSQSTTLSTTRQAGNSITNRRDEERERCAAGFSRVNGICEPNMPRVNEDIAPPPPAPAAKPRVASKAKKSTLAKAEVPAPRKLTYVRKEAPSPTFVPTPIEAPLRYGVWGQVFGVYEKRDANGLTSINGPDFNSGAPVPLDTYVQSRVGTIGFQAGLDVTTHGLFTPTDGAIIGILVGHVSSNLTLNTQQFSTNPSVVGNGFSHLTAQLAGPTLGAYATYFSGGFSADLLVKFDLLRLNQTFTDNLAFAGPAGPFNLTATGFGSTSLLNTSVVANLNYRFDLNPNFWVEPTVGAQFIALDYGSGAADLGLQNGNQVTVQGGARIGTVSTYDNILIKTTLTGLAYDDVAINGGFIPGAAYNGNNILANADRGQVRGRGTLAFNIDFGQGLSSFVLGDVYGGKGLFGTGGRAGIRYEF